MRDIIGLMFATNVMSRFRHNLANATRHQQMSGPDVFVTIAFGIITLIISFGMTLALLGDNSNITMMSETIAGGLRLIYPLAQKSAHSPERALSGSTAADSFWEAPGPFPIELTVEFPQPRTLSSYLLKAGEDGSRMPTVWTVEGSNDGQRWKLLDKEAIKGLWEPYSLKELRLGYDQPLRQLRFRFLAGNDRSFLRLYGIEFH
jgi:hypothetical protein